MVTGGFSRGSGLVARMSCKGMHESEWGEGCDGIC
jgi:hypothetical protein